jgi:hypothetical protein
MFVAFLVAWRDVADVLAHAVERFHARNSPKNSKFLDRFLEGNADL